MKSAASDPRRRIAPGAYAIFFSFFAAILFLGHLSLLRLPYFWDEAGQFVPAALDILHGGHFVPRSATPNIHPPGVMSYLALAWRAAGFHAATTRCAMLLLGAVGVLAAFLLAIELSRGIRGMPAFVAAAMLCASPLYFAQSMLAQLDAPAMLFTTLALLFFLQDRVRLSAAMCVGLVLVKETGLVIAFVLAVWLLAERRWKDAAWFAAPALVLGTWLLVLWRATGNWAGNPEFEWYNVDYAVRPARFLVTLARRVYYLAVANGHWIGAAAVVAVWRCGALFRDRSWRVAGTVLAAHVITVSALGGAVLERYLLPVVPIVYAAMSGALWSCGRRAKLIGSAAIVAVLIASNFINPLYPFPYDDNLAFVDFVKLHSEAAAYLEAWRPNATVLTAWPLSAELSHPPLGFVRSGMRTELLQELNAETLKAVDWNRVDTLAVFSRNWNPPLGAIRYAPVANFWRRYYGYTPQVTAEEARAIIPMRLAAYFERRGQWVAVYVRGGAASPALARGRPAEPHPVN